MHGNSFRLEKSTKYICLNCQTEPREREATEYLDFRALHRLRIEVD